MAVAGSGRNGLTGSNIFEAKMKRALWVHRVGSQKGLTLVEIIIVLVILSLLMTFLTRGLFGQAEKAKVQMTVMGMKKVQNAIQQYQLMNNALPPSLDALVSCERSSGTVCMATAEAEDLKDSWGTPFQYQSSGNSYQLKSLGADKREGGDGVNADVTVTGP